MEVPDDYAGHTWAAIAAERGDGIGAAILRFLICRDVLPAVALPSRRARLAAFPFASAAPDHR